MARVKPTEGCAILGRDGGKTASPNAGKPMAVMAGLLGVQLDKKNCYILGDPRHELTTDMIGQAWNIVAVAAILLLEWMMVVFLSLAII